MKNVSAQYRSTQTPTRETTIAKGDNSATIHSLPLYLHPPPPPPPPPTSLQIAGPGILRRGGTGRSDLKDRHSTSSPRQQIRRHCDHCRCRGRCYSVSSRPPTLSPRVVCVRRGTQHLAPLSIASVALTYLFTRHLPQSQCRNICNVEELETLPAGTKPRTPHHRSPGGERGRGSERQSSLNWR